MELTPKHNIVNYGIKVSIVCALMFFLIQLVGIFHHEPWMDEFQAFQIAMNSHSLSNLFYNMRYEGHPAMWHLLLYAITRFTDNIFAMQLAHIIIATASIFILFRYAPFSFAEKILLSLGYFMFYEYAQVSRCYAIGLFAAVSICAILGKYYKLKSLGKSALTSSLIFSISFLLALLTNSSSYGVLIAGGLAFYLMLIIWDEWSQIKTNTRLKLSLLCSIVIVLLGYCGAIFMLIPQPGNFISSSFPKGFDLYFINYVLQQPLMAYLPIPYSTEIGSWCSSFIFHCKPQVFAYISLAFVLLLALSFIQRSRILLLYFIYTITIGGFLLYFPHWWVAPRYYGHFFIALFICYWLEKYINPGKPIFGFIPTLKKTLFYFILITQACVGVYFYYLDFRYPFSNTAKAGEYIQQHHLDRFPAVGGIDAFVLPLSYYTHKPVFTFERNDTSRFVIYDSKKKNTVTPDEVTNEIIHVVNNSKTDTALLCMSFMWKAIDKTGKMSDFEEGTIARNYGVKLLQKIDAPTVLANNNFYLFLVWKKPQPN